MNNYINATELSKLKLDASILPSAVKNILDKAKRENWQSRKRTGRGGGYEYEIASMPSEIQAAIAAKLAEQALQNAPALPEHIQAASSKKPNKKMLQLGLIPVDEALASLDDEQKNCAFARIALVSYVLVLYHNANRDAAGNQLPKSQMRLNLKDAADDVAARATAGTLGADKQHFVAVANNRTGEKRQGLSGSTLYRWVRLFQAAKGSTADKVRTAQILALAPDKTRKKTPLAARVWLPDFQRYYNTPNKPTIKQALGQLAKEYCCVSKDCPSYDVVERVVKAMPIQMQMRGRVTGSEFKQYLPYIERDWQALQVNDLWVGDGHSFKATVQHPDHGRAFTPEVTVIIDGCSGAVMGWSVKLSESAVAVADALRHGMTKFPPPLAYYSDNGAGETADMLDKEVTGILPRLGIEHMTGIPGNPQGRGRIERLWQTTLIPLAKTYATYKGRDADNGTFRKVSQAMTSMIKAEKRGKELTPVQAAAKQALPKWRDFVADLTEMIRWYNEEHEHSSLPINPQTGKHFTPMAYYQYRLNSDGLRVMQEPLSELELDFMYRPEETRITHRGLVMVWRNSYFLPELAAYHGKKVRISYDLHDASSVIVKEMSGKLIGKAKFGGNRRVAFAETRMEQLAENRRQGQIRLLNAKKEVVELERKSALPALEHQPDFRDFMTQGLEQPAHEWDILDALPLMPKSQSSKNRDDEPPEIVDFEWQLRKYG